MKVVAILAFIFAAGEFALGCAVMVPSRGAGLLLTWPVAAVIFAVGLDLWRDS